MPFEPFTSFITISSIFFNAVRGPCLDRPRMPGFVPAGLGVGAVSVEGLISHVSAMMSAMPVTWFARMLTACAPGFDDSPAAAGVEDHLLMDLFVVSAMHHAGFAFVGDDLTEGIENGHIAIDRFGRGHPHMLDHCTGNRTGDDNRPRATGVYGYADAGAMVSGGHADVGFVISGEDAEVEVESSGQGSSGGG